MSAVVFSYSKLRREYIAIASTNALSTYCMGPLDFNCSAVQPQDLTLFDDITGLILYFIYTFVICQLDNLL